MNLINQKEDFPHVDALKKAFENIGVSISTDDVPLILRLGVDAYLKQVRLMPSEEIMSGIYIILSEMREANQKNLNL